MRTFSLELFHITCYIKRINFVALEKGKKGCNMTEIILVQGFCPQKIKITVKIKINKYKPPKLVT